MILEILVPTCQHLVGALAKVIHWNVSFSTWGVASTTVCLKKEADRQLPNDFFVFRNILLIWHFNDINIWYNKVYQHKYLLQKSLKTKYLMPPPPSPDFIKFTLVNTHYFIYFSWEKTEKDTFPIKDLKSPRSISYICKPDERYVYFFSIFDYSHYQVPVLLSYKKKLKTTVLSSHFLTRCVYRVFYMLIQISVLILNSPLANFLSINS